MPKGSDTYLPCFHGFTCWFVHLFAAAKRDWHMLTFHWLNGHHLYSCDPLIWGHQKGLTYACLSLVEWAWLVCMWPTYLRAPKRTDKCLPFIGWMGIISMHVTHLFEGTKWEWHACLSLAEWVSLVCSWFTCLMVPRGSDTYLPFIGWMGFIVVHLIHLFDDAKRADMLVFHWLNRLH